jgi:DNA adenine methylase
MARRRKGELPLTRNRTRRHRNGNVSEWEGAVDGLPAVRERIRRVAFECKPALDLIRSEDKPGTLFYCDPPYLPGTRASLDAYAFEMTEADHRELPDTLRRCRGKVMLSGYPSAWYDTTLAGWKRFVFDLPNHTAGGESKRRMTECVWCNF